MVKHIVFWRLKSRGDEAARDADARAIKSKIEAIRGRIPGLQRIEAGIDFSRTESSFDVVLYSEFESRAALDGYQIHPVHQEMAAYIAERRGDRAIVDYDA